MSEGVYLGKSLVGICTVQYEKLAGWVKKPSEKMYEYKLRRIEIS
jgi:hypothetical protein